MSDFLACRAWIFRPFVSFVNAGFQLEIKYSAFGAFTFELMLKYILVAWQDHQFTLETQLEKYMEFFCLLLKLIDNKVCTGLVSFFLIDGLYGMGTWWRFVHFSHLNLVPAFNQNNYFLGKKISNCWYFKVQISLSNFKFSC